MRSDLYDKQQSSISNWRSTRIGFKIAERLVEDGFKVAVVDFNEEGQKQLHLNYQVMVQKLLLSKQMYQTVMMYLMQ